MTESQSPPFQEILETGIQDYFNGRLQHVPCFVKTHFQYPGCWHINKLAFGSDLLRAPVNLLWAPFYVAIVLVCMVCSLCGFRWAGNLAAKMPGGFTTRVQSHVNELVKAELIDEEAMGDFLTQRLQRALPNAYETERIDNHNRLEIIVKDALSQLMLTRTASADISNTLLSTAMGALLFKKFTPGGIGIGFVLAAVWAQEHAARNFFLGDWAGKWFYTLFPPSPGLIEQVIAVFLVMLMLSVFASFSGLLTDPVQAHLGLHSRRLRKMLRQLEQDMLARSKSRFKPLDPYVARILEIFDLLKAQL